MTFIGTWRITGMEQWDQEAYDLMGPAFFRFERGGTGHFRFIAVEGQMDWLTTPASQRFVARRRPRPPVGGAVRRRGGR
jgi:hypothetical protein